jgi:hypothetical protein
MVMRSFLLFRGSQPGLFYDLSTGDSRPPRLSGSRWRAGLPPPHSLPTSRESCGFHPLTSREKDSGLHTSHSRKDLMTLHDVANYLMLSVGIPVLPSPLRCITAQINLPQPYSDFLNLPILFQLSQPLFVRNALIVSKVR